MVGCEHSLPVPDDLARGLREGRRRYGHKNPLLFSDRIQAFVLDFHSDVLRPALDGHGPVRSRAWPPFAVLFAVAGCRRPDRMDPARSIPSSQGSSSDKV